MHNLTCVRYESIRISINQVRIGHITVTCPKEVLIQICQSSLVQRANPNLFFIFCLFFVQYRKIQLSVGFELRFVDLWSRIGWHHHGPSYAKVNFFSFEEVF